MKTTLRSLTRLSLLCLALTAASCASYNVGVNRAETDEEIDEETMELLSPRLGRNADVDSPYERY